MKATTGITFALALLCAAPATAQSSSQLKKDLRAMEKAAKKDPDKLFEAAVWARGKQLDKDADRLLKKVLKEDPEHAGANEAMGNELVDGKWLPAEEAAKLRDKALEAEYADKGFTKVDGVWVKPENVEDAKKGIFHHEGELVSRHDKLELMSGKVRHPVTGMLIDKDKLEKANQGYFPIAGGKWVDRKEADKFHRELNRPWMFRTYNTTILSTLPLDQLEKLKNFADQGHEKAASVLGGRALPPTKRPLLMVASTNDEYTQLGNQFGDGTDAAGAFLMTDEAVMTVNGREVRPAITVNDKDWGERYLRHAAGIAYINAVAELDGVDLPLWFVHGVGALTSRFQNDSDAGWFGKQHVQKGGVGNVKSFFNSFAIDSSIDPKQIGFNIYQAGLLLSYAMRGGDQEVTDAMVAVTDSLSGKGGNPTKAIEELEKLLIKSEDGIKAHLQELLKKAP